MLFSNVKLQKIEIYIRNNYYEISSMIILSSFTAIEIWVSYELKLHITVSPLVAKKFTILLALFILFPFNSFLGLQLIVSKTSDKQKSLIATTLFGYFPLLFFTIY
jgi:hypothetical protein